MGETTIYPESGDRRYWRRAAFVVGLAFAAIAMLKADLVPEWDAWEKSPESWLLFAICWLCVAIYLKPKVTVTVVTNEPARPHPEGGDRQ